MRILVLSNFYPPHYVGGYELGCRDVVEALKAHGHEVRVLTSVRGVARPTVEGEVFRWLHLDPDPEALARGAYIRALFARERNNQRCFRSVCDRFRPDVVYAWKLSGVSVTSVYQAERRGLPVAYFVSDDWLARWEVDPWRWLRDFQAPTRTGRIVRASLGVAAKSLGLLWPPAALDLRHTQFASAYLKRNALEAGKDVSAGEIIHWGVDTDRYGFRREARPPSRLLYVGQIVKIKGVHTAVEAFRRLVDQPGGESATLTITGGSIDPGYEAGIRRRVEALGLKDRVRFTGGLERGRLPSLYREHDILLFPSVWPEPFGITPLEAMACGLAVVGTHTGGSPEMFEDGVNALVFEKEDADDCARQALRLLRDPDLYETLRRQARRDVERRFTFSAMEEKIECSLRKAVEDHAAPSGTGGAG